MFGLRLKSIRLYATLCFVLVILCASGGKEGDPKDVATDGATDKKSKILGNPDLSNKDQLTQLLESLSPEDIAKLENMTEKEAEEKTAFLSPEEGCDFLAMGSLFDDPDYHKNLLQDYVAMEHLGYWEMRCEEFDYKYTGDPNVKDTAVHKPSYCT